MITMSEDAKAILLLCGYLGGDGSGMPLNQGEYTQVVRWLVEKKLRPSDLLVPDPVTPLAQDTGLNEQRLSALLRRGVLLGFAVERWNQSGIWVICRSDREYPKRYWEHLKDKAPPILFGAGDRTLLQGGGFAIVGSRDVDAEGEAFARDVAVRCAREGLPVVSGGARGVDQVAMSAALEAGGIVLGVLADTLLRRSVERESRRALADNRLLLISPYNPEAGFNVGNAMGRNKLIYALADYGLVVSSDYNKGGTWEGAVEELKREQSLPVFVRTGPKVPKGNLELLKKGARAFPSDGLTGNLREAVARATSQTAAPVESAVVAPELPVLAAPASRYEACRREGRKTTFCGCACACQRVRARCDAGERSGRRHRVGRCKAADPAGLGQTHERRQIGEGARCPQGPDAGLGDGDGDRWRFGGRGKA